MTTTSSRDLSTPHTHCTVQTTHRRASQSMNATRLLATSPLVWVRSLANDTILMTSNGPNCQNCFRFFTTGSRPIISESTRPTFAQFSGFVALWLQMIAVKLDCDRSRDVGTLPRQPIFVYQIHIFFATVTNVYQTLCIQPRRARPFAGVIHEVDRRPGLLTTPIHRGTDISPSGISSTLTCDGVTTRSASAALDAREPVN